MYGYFGASHIHQNIPVVIETMTILADRPKRGTINNILNHASLSKKRWGYAVYLNQKNLHAMLAFQTVYRNCLLVLYLNVDNVVTRHYNAT